MQKKGRQMNRIRRVIRHPAGILGLAVGLTIGVVAALMGETRKALVFVSFCQYMAGRIGR